MTGELSSRVRAAAEVLLDGEAPTGLGDLLEVLVVSLRDDRDDDRLWLLMTCIAAAMPEADDLRAVRRTVRTRPVQEALEHLMTVCLACARRRGRADVPVTVLVDQVLVEVHQSAASDLHRGMPRVVRSLLPHWHARRGVIPVAWTSRLGLLRRLTPIEAGRVVAWGRAAGPAVDVGVEELVVPWRCVLVLPEIPLSAVCGQLAALARSSGNVVTAIGHDTSPVTRADLLTPLTVSRFMHYLGLVKHLRRVAGVSASAAGDFRGFVDMLPSQGLVGPDVVECRLPTEVTLSGWPSTPPPAEGDPPSVLAVGGLDPRKNALALLHVSELLWREGHRFSLTIVSPVAQGQHPEALAVVRRLRRRGRDLRLVAAVPDGDLRAAYERARFTVFCSLHEGFGLPVAESVGLGTPVITTSYGSTREVAEGGGALLVDPRSDDELLAAMRSLLTDDDLLDRLRAECATRPVRTWATYADELWSALVELHEPEAAR